MARTPPKADDPLTKPLPTLMREHAISYRALAAQTRLVDSTGDGLSHSHLVNLAAGRELPSRRALELLASVFQLGAEPYRTDVPHGPIRESSSAESVGTDPAPTRCRSRSGSAFQRS